MCPIICKILAESPSRKTDKNIFLSLKISTRIVDKYLQAEFKGKTYSIFLFSHSNFL